MSTLSSQPVYVLCIFVSVEGNIKMLLRTFLSTGPLCIANAGQAVSPQGQRNTRGQPSWVQCAAGVWLHNLNWRHTERQFSTPLLKFALISGLVLILFQSALQRVNSDGETVLKTQPWGGQEHTSHFAPWNPRDIDPFSSVSSSKTYLCKWNWTLKQELCWNLYALNIRTDEFVSLGAYRCFPSNRSNVRQTSNARLLGWRSGYIFLLSPVLLSPYCLNKQ